ncbi:SLAM family member 7-like isoform X2 [Salvelinus alpinus]|uniref:SLAM family member 7-like isoform X2 n=1 Tax=Salvelinus alpinus TaxID=8036 RepID=UPI0039FD867F
MSKLTLIGLCFWLYVAQKFVSGEDLYKVGGELVLKPDKSTVPHSITSILWKHGKNKVAEWDNGFGGLDIYGAFKERTTLDQTTGELRISGLMKTDSGVYSVEFNSKLLDKTYKLSVIKAVPKPTITFSCNANKTSCTLTCEGDTTDAEPVTYSWKVGEGAWEVIGKQLIVSQSDTGKSTNSYKYICKLKNDVRGEGEVSEPVGQVFGSEPSEIDVGVVVGVVVTIVALVAIVITVWLVWKKIKAAEASGSNSPKYDSTPETKGSDVVQPEQEVTVPLTVNHKTGEEDADKPGKGQENGAGGLPGW